MIKILKKLLPIIKSADEIISFFEITIKKEKPALIILLFHGLYDGNRAENPDRTLMASADQLEEAVKYYLEAGYKFLTPDDIGVRVNSGKNILLTFDDGYYNNILALPILEKYQIPAIFFISTNYVKNKKKFWWDALRSTLVKQGLSDYAITEKIKSHKRQTPDQINALATDAVAGKDDANRPFTEEELTDFSRKKLVYIGNHTADHAILTNCENHEQIKYQIAEAQEYLYKITGKKPSAIAYPNGKYSSAIMAIAKNNGLTTGITTDQRKNYLPLDKDGTEIMRLGRFWVNGNKNIRSQCRSFRYDRTLSIERLLRKLFKHYEKTATNQGSD